MNLLLIGTGSIGKRHFLNFKQILPQSKVAIYKTSAAPLDLVTFENASVFFDLEAAITYLERPYFAILALPPFFQPKILEKLVSHKIPYLVEKPVAIDSYFISNIVKDTLNNNLFSMVAFNMRFHPCYIKLKALLKNDKIGNLISFFATVGQDLTTWRPSTNYYESYSASSKQGGGVHLDLIHEIEYVSSLFGDPFHIYLEKSKRSSLNIDSDDNAQYLIRFKNGLSGSIHLNYVQLLPCRKIEIVGDLGTLKVDFLSAKIYLETQEGKALIFEDNQFERNFMYINLMHYFLDTLASNQIENELNINRGYNVLKWANGKII